MNFMIKFFFFSKNGFWWCFCFEGHKLCMSMSQKYVGVIYRMFFSIEFETDWHSFHTGFAHCVLEIVYNPRCLVGLFGCLCLLSLLLLQQGQRKECS